MNRARNSQLMRPQEQLVQSTRTSLQAAREAYSTAISQRSSSQREVNELLQRKHAWTPNDLERFTALYRSDHANEQTETAAQENLVASERRAEEVAAKLSASILARYHEEQIWSDKIRRMSTWGTWGLMGVNVLLFLVFQIGVEPWRRKRLVKGFEDKVMEALDREAQPSRDMAVSSKVADQSLTASSSSENMIPTATESEPKLMLLANEAKPSENNLVAIEPDGRSALGIHPTLTIFQRMQSLVQDLFSKREVVISRLDLTVVALEGAAAGTVIATAVLMLFKYR